jgi:multidrug efflux pump
MEGGQEVSFAEMKRLQAAVEGKIRNAREVTGVVSVVGVTPINATPNAARLAVTLRSLDERKVPVKDVIVRLQQAVAAVPGVVVYFRPVQDIQISTRLSRAQYQYTLTGTDPREVGDSAARLTQELRKYEEMRDVVSEAQDGGFGMDVQIDRELAGRLGVSVQTIVDTLSDAFGQRQISTIYGQANQYRVILEAKPEYQNDPSALTKIYVPASGIQAVAQSTSLTSTSPTNIPTVSGSAMVPLNTVARFQYTTAPLVIAHQEQFPAVTISFNLAPGAALSGAVRLIAHAEQEIGMPSSVIGSYSGDAAEFEKSLAGEPWLILAAAITIYIVLGVRGRAQAGPFAARVDRPGLDAALPPDHDDDAGGAVRRHPAGVRERNRLGAAQSARHHHHRRPAAEPAAHSLHHPGGLSGDGAPQDAFDRRHRIAPGRARVAGPARALAARGGVRPL